VNLFTETTKRSLFALLFAGALIIGSLSIRAGVYDVRTNNSVAGTQKSNIAATAQPATTSIASITPQRLQIPSIGVEAAVESVGVNDQGNMKAPDDWRHVSWYQPGFAPGESGNAVFSGHLDWDDNQAVFWELDELSYGDVVRISGEVRELIYMVTDTEQYDYQVSDTSQIFGKASTSQIKLITCDGEFIDDSDTYQKRLIVTGKLITTQGNQPLPTSTQSIQTETI
jgi:LPXTG-site transpeptidase (sortase) family protein